MRVLACVLTVTMLLGSADCYGQSARDISRLEKYRQQFKKSNRNKIKKVATVSEVKPRKWTTAKGKTLGVALYVKYEKGKVYLKREDVVKDGKVVKVGESFVVAMKELGVKDKAVVRARLRELLRHKRKAASKPKRRKRRRR